MTRKRRSTLIAFAAIAGLVLGACGDDDDSDDGAARSGPTLTGAPVRLMVITGIDPPPGVLSTGEAVDGAQAAAAAINNAGGINGRPIEILSCDSKNQPNESAACGRRAVDEGVVAVVGAADLAGGYYAALEPAGIPSVASVGSARADLTSPVSYPIAAGVGALLAGAPSVLADVAGATNITYVYVDVPTATGLLGYVDQAMALRGLDYRKIAVPVGATDLSAYAARATSGGTDGVAMTLGTSDADKMIVALRQSGYDGAIARGSSLFPPSSVKTLGAAADGIYLNAGILPRTSDDPAVRQWVKDMENHDSNAPLDDISGNAYAGVRLIAEALRAAPTVDSAGLIAALTAPGATFDTVLYPPSQFTTPASANSPLPRVFNNTMIYAQIEDGEPRLVDGARYLDPTKEIFTR